MIISLKDSFKLLGVSIISFCAVFVCTFFLNYYLDIIPLKDSISNEILPLYNAQVATAKMTCSITGIFLCLIAIITLLFYIKLYVDNNHKAIGLFKAMGYSNYKIAKSFMIFGLSVFIGCLLGFIFGWIFMHPIYKSLTIEGMNVIKPKFHIELLICLVILPTILFSLISFIYASTILKRSTINIMRGELKVKKAKTMSSSKNKTFFKEMCFASLKCNKLLVFFVAFSCFCFSSMVQMGLSMEDLVEGTMGFMILIIGLVLAIVSMILAMTSLIKNNVKNIAVMKSLGFNKKECFYYIFLGYIPFAFLGFIIGTIYQYGLLSFMINIIFKDVGNVPSYSFNIPILFLTIFLFIFFYSLVFILYMYKANKVSIKKTMLDY